MKYVSVRDEVTAIQFKDFEEDTLLAIGSLGVKFSTYAERGLGGARYIALYPSNSVTIYVYVGDYVIKSVDGKIGKLSESEFNLRYIPLDSLKSGSVESSLGFEYNTLQKRLNKINIEIKIGEENLIESKHLTPELYNKLKKRVDMLKLQQLAMKIYKEVLEMRVQDENSVN